MKRIIVALIVGIAIGASSIASAEGLVYWERGGSTYMCEGTYRSVFCRETNWRGSKYGADIIPGQIDVTYGGRIIFSCERRLTPADNCAYYGR